MKHDSTNQTLELDDAYTSIVSLDKYPRPDSQMKDNLRKSKNSI